jgi:shikimate kinase
MGSGKSTVGAALAEQLGWRFIDLDLELVNREGRTIAEIFGNEGEPRFREIESELLRQLLGELETPAVIALGGGTFIQSANREAIASRGALSVYLDGDFDLLLSRCRVEEGGRPLMQDPAHFRYLFEQRRPIYRLADVVVSVADRSPQEIAAVIAAHVHGQQAQPAVPE